VKKIPSFYCYLFHYKVYVFLQWKNILHIIVPINLYAPKDNFNSVNK